ncbi:MAG: pyridoxal 5'-phosphate synthase glutaminase subunit PdxT [Anaerolineae bacterium]|nr:pyridoxal 5'-phosphate synthase glutaminase subunit PdxT [Thermoflexales bacterium]MDW8408494.1 pyridoxal 5'-phosphate synthase glutaminase subunit PdxT [Anaerolineae bacterium]
MRIGVLALQGDFIEHEHMLARLGIEAVEVRLPRELEGLDGLIMPGGESTTFGKLAVRFGLVEPLRAFAQSGRPVWGTCAGLIFLAKDVGRDQVTLGLMDVRVKRNAFGRQIDSFICDLQIVGLEDKPFPGVFIRAPIIESVGERVHTLCRLEDGTIVAARQDNLLATAFHPELTDDLRMHALFAQVCERSSPGRVAYET